MNQASKLSLEQSSLKNFGSQVQQMSREQAQELLLKLCEQTIIRETTYLQLLKHESKL